MKIRVAVIGVGYLGQHHARVFAGLPDVELRYVVDIIPERAYTIAEQYGAIPLEDYRAVPVSEIDAVSIVTPTTTHYEIALHFLRCGVATFVEKPLTMTSQQALHLVEESQRTETPLFVGHIERFNPVGSRFPVLRDAESPVFIEIHRVHPFVPRGTDVDIVMDLMIHDLDLLLAQVGRPPQILDAVGIPVVTHQIDAASVRLQWDHLRVNLVASRVSHMHTRRWMIFAAGRYVSLDFLHRQVTQIQMDETHPGHLVIQDVRCDSPKELLWMELQAFAQAVRRGYAVPPLATGPEGLAAIRLAEQIRASMEQVRHPDLTPWVMTAV
ncbi:scyllo-inositol 2-dehydrogenase (NAD(+)) [bacterium HR11]|nr:scyllo-inositol 2-dehydrogenase (NAD(+)) [bacterium HR11]